MELEAAQIIGLAIDHHGKVISRGTDDVVAASIHTYIPTKRYKSLDLHLVFDDPEAIIRFTRIRFKTLKDVMAFLNDDMLPAIYSFSISYNI